MDDAAESASPPARKPIWLWALLAMGIATALACAVAILSGDELASRADYETRGEDYTVGIEAVFALGVPLVAALLVWAVFHFAMFRKRAKLWKSLLGLLAILLTTLFFGVIARVATFGYYMTKDEEAVHAIQVRVNQRLDALRTQLGGKRQEGIAKLDRILEPGSTTRRYFGLQYQILDNLEEAMNFLLSHRSAWIVERDALVFTDRDAMGGYHEIMEQNYDLTRQLDLLEGRGGPGIRPAELPDEHNTAEQSGG